MFDHPFEAGAAYALYRHGQDVQAEDIADALATAPPPAAATQLDVRVHLDDSDDPDKAVVINALDFISDTLPETWDDYIGQDALKLRMQVMINSAQTRAEPLPHMLIVANAPGTGKTTIARMIARAMNVGIIELAPPFDNIYVLVKAAEQLLDNEILFIDEIHLLKQKRNGDQILLKILEDRVAYLPNGEVVNFNNITVIGATTEMDALAEPVVDRFEVQRLRPYTPEQLTRIAIKFAARFDVLHVVDDELAVSIADASRGAPREVRKLILATKRLFDTLSRPPTAEELLSYAEIEPDGLAQQHVAYLTLMRQSGRRVSKAYGVEYIGGESHQMTLLRETKPGIGRIERYLMERGLIEKTPRGRRLTDRGIARAEQLIAEGKGQQEF